MSVFKFFIIEKIRTQWGIKYVQTLTRKMIWIIWIGLRYFSQVSWLFHPISFINSMRPRYNMSQYDTISSIFMLQLQKLINLHSEQMVPSSCILNEEIYRYFYHKICFYWKDSRICRSHNVYRLFQRFQNILWRVQNLVSHEKQYSLWSA